MRTVIFFVLVVLFLFAIVRINDQPSDIAGNEVALNFTQRAVGGLIAATAAFLLLLFGAAGETPERQIGLILPLLGGILLVSSHWSVALAFGAVGIALIARAWFGKKT